MANDWPMRIKPMSQVKPFVIYTQQIPLAWRTAAQGIIEPAGEKPSVWYHSLVAVAKPTGSVKITGYVEAEFTSNSPSTPSTNTLFCHKKHCYQGPSNSQHLMLYVDIGRCPLMMTNT